MKPIVLSEKDESRFWAKVSPEDPETGCMIWNAGLGADGRYGRFQLNGKVQYAHRVALTLRLGRQVREDASVDHACHITQCVNPDHLHEVTYKANSENRRGAQQGAKSGIRGVTWVESHGQWSVRAGHNGVRHWGGYFDNLKDAEKAAIELRNGLFTNNLGDRRNSRAA